MARIAHGNLINKISHNRNGSLGIAPTFLNFDSWLPGAGFIPIISTKGINQIKKENCKKKVKFYAYKKI